MANTSIEWTDKTWNPTVGCTNCYAMKMAERLEAMASKPDGSGNFHLDHYKGTTSRGDHHNKPVHWTGVVKVAPDSTLLAPLKWKKPARIFVNSMSDLFHESVPDEVIDKVFAVMALCPQHTFQILTKRSKRMREYLDCDLFLKMQNFVDYWEAKDTFPFQKREAPWLKDRFDFNTGLPDRSWLTNVWLGVSAEDQQRWDERVHDLEGTLAAVRFVSIEPMIGHIDTGHTPSPVVTPEDEGYYHNALVGGDIHYITYDSGITDATDGPLMPGIDWIIVGGESGSDRRPMQIEWAEDIMRQCRETGTAFFFKQDSGPRAGMRGRASDELWAYKQMPEVK